jgi:hypothetical protein
MMAQSVKIFEAISSDRFRIGQSVSQWKETISCYPGEVFYFCEIGVEKFMAGLIGEFWYKFRDVHLSGNRLFSHPNLCYR